MAIILRKSFISKRLKGYLLGLHLTGYQSIGIYLSTIAKPLCGFKFMNGKNEIQRYQ